MTVTEMFKMLFGLHELHCMCVCVSRINAFFCLCNFCVPLLFAVLQTLFNSPRKAVVFLPSFLNPNFIPTLQQPSSMLSPSPLTVVSSHLSPLQQSSESQLSFSFVLCFPQSHFAIFAPKVANVQLKQSFQKSIHTVKVQLVGNAHPSIQSWWCHFSPCCRCLAQLLLLDLFFTAQDAAVSSRDPSRCSETAFLVFRERFLELVFSGWQTHGS